MDKNQGPVATPTSSDVLEAAMRQTMRAINCVQIGVIDAFDAATQLANVRLSLKQVKDIFEDGTRTYQEYPALLECPVVTLFGGADFLSLPVTAGDSCIVLFNDREIDNWLNAGDGQAPTTLRMHDMSDAFALVGIRPLTNSIVGFLANGIRLSHGGGDSRLDLKSGLIEAVATLFLQNGNMQVTGNLAVEGNLTVTGTAQGEGGSALSVGSDVTLSAGKILMAPQLKAGNGANGTFSTVTVVDGIVTGGTL